MKGEPKYNDKLTLSEFRIAAMDEIDLESIVWDARDQTDEYHQADIAALREIDRLKLEGAYDSERARLAALDVRLPPEVEAMLQTVDITDLSPLTNFLNGLESPDPAQRAKFEKMYSKGNLAEKSWQDVQYFLDCLEEAKRPKGRPGVSPPWRNVVEVLDAMRLSVAKGATIPEAAREQAEKEGRAEQNNRAGYFEKLYRQRAALRE